MFLSFTLVMSASLLIFLAAAALFTVAFGDRPRVEIEGGEPPRLAESSSCIVMTAMAQFDAQRAM